jgi:hypothetical protein
MANRSVFFLRQHFWFQSEEEIFPFYLIGNSTNIFSVLYRKESVKPSTTIRKTKNFKNLVAILENWKRCITNATADS